MQDTDTIKDIFRKMVQKHDLTYSYSDDGSVYANGKAEYDAIITFRNNNMTRREAAKIWNDVVRTKVRFPDEWLWYEEN